MEKMPGRGLITIPNLLSLFRLGLIPLFVRLYALQHKELLGCGVLLLSGATDILDGYIARRFDMTSDVGKILDPVADKLTQAATLICLAEKFPLMLMPLLLLFIKELFGGILCFLAIKSSGEIQSSHWHGKLNTVLLYSMLILHLLWPDLPAALSAVSIGICVGMMLFSAFMYAMGNIALLRKRRNMP